MTTPRQEGRANQKARTRAAIVAAASELAAAGREPTVAAAAVAAGVSRATAYRYFPTQDALLVEVTQVGPSVAAIERDLAALTTDDVEARVLAVLDAINPLALAEEEHYRRALWVYLDTWLRNARSGEEPPAVREGRRMRWLDHALEPAHGLTDDRRKRLKAALALTLSIDAVVIMKDVCLLDDEEALDVLRWAARALLSAGLDGPPPGAG